MVDQYAKKYPPVINRWIFDLILRKNQIKYTKKPIPIVKRVMRVSTKA